MGGLKKVIITGANGLIGHAIIDKIYTTYEIYAVVSGRNPVDFPKSVHIIKANLLDSKDREYIMTQIKPEIFLHYAWDVQDVDFEASENNIIWTEVSLHLLRCFVANAGRRMIFAGSGAEYGTVNEKRVENIVFPYVKLSLYGETKLAFADIMKNYCSAHGVEFVDARYFSVYGENDKRVYAVIPNTIISLLNNKPVVCKYPDNVWDYIYIEDAVNVSIKLIESAYCGSVNICSGIPHRMEDVFRVIAQKLDKEGLVTFDRNNGCNRVWVGDTNIMAQELECKCMVPFDVGIKRTIDYLSCSNNI
jgi:nucleoside-diphosphate-sugar epimerase